jgi:hypothetical protein
VIVEMIKNSLPKSNFLHSSLLQDVTYHHATGDDMKNNRQVEEVEIK